jgi:hypothetical protein
VEFAITARRRLLFRLSGTDAAASSEVPITILGGLGGSVAAAGFAVVVTAAVISGKYSEIV